MTPDNTAAPARHREDVWTLQTWMLEDPPPPAGDGYRYGYPSRESAERNGQMFAEDERAAHWRVLNPAGELVASWDRSITFGPCPACESWGIEVPLGFPPDELEQLIIDHDQAEHPGELPALAEHNRRFAQQLLDLARRPASSG